MANTPQVRFSDTLPADEISKELLPVVKALGVQKNCEELATEGWTEAEEERLSHLQPASCLLGPDDLHRC